MQYKEIIFGAPGCGKTRKLMTILEQELRLLSPERIAYVSFTKKGAEEGLSRARELFDYPNKAFNYFKTIHAICFQVLRVSRSDIMSRKDYKVFSDAMGMRFVGYYTEEFYHSDDRYLHLHLLKQNNPKAYEQMLETIDINLHDLEHVTNNYERFKEHISKYDFTDLLTKVVKQGNSLDIDVAIIDEAQDLTTLQWDVCDVLFRNAKRIYIAGDDDQAIYEWTGADVHKFLSIAGEKIILDKSWRLKKNLLDFSKRITSLISERVAKNFAPIEDGGGIFFHNTVENFDFKENETYYCLGRNNYHLSVYTDELRKQAKVYKFKDKLSYNENIVRAINNFEAFKTGLLNEEDAIYVRQYLRLDIVNIHRLSWFEALSLTPDEAFYYKQLIKNKVELGDEKILVSTIHGVKGGEADNVLLLMDITRTVYKHVTEFSDSELRCLYVACTRAKNNLHIIYPSTKYSYSVLLESLDILKEQ